MDRRRTGDRLSLCRGRAEPDAADVVADLESPQQSDRNESLIFVVDTARRTAEQFAPSPRHRSARRSNVLSAVVPQYAALLTARGDRTQIN